MRENHGRKSGGLDEDERNMPRWEERLMELAGTEIRASQQLARKELDPELLLLR
jgi:hypothetical protein